MKRYILLILLSVTTHILFGQNTILWKVIDTTNNKESVMLGTFHQMGNSFVDSIPIIQEYLFKSDLAVFESIDKREGTQKMINDREKSYEIEKALKKKDLNFLIKEFKKKEVDLYKLEPVELRWILAHKFLREKCQTVKNTDKWNHFDRYLQFLANSRNIKTFGLETDSLQLELIRKENKNPNWKDEKKRIHYWIEQLKSEKPNEIHCAMAKKYKKFDLDYNFSTECNDDVLLKERNENWLKIIPDLLRKNNCFIAVGLFHLYKKCGLIEQLKSKGFIVERIELN